MEEDTELDTAPAMGSDATDETEDDASGKRRRLSDTEWASAKEAYMRGEKGVTEIASELGVSRQSLSRRFQTAGIRRGSLAEEEAAAAAEAARKTTERFASKRAEMIEETRSTGVLALKQHRMVAQKLFVDMVRNKEDPAVRDDDFKALQRYGKLMGDSILMSLKVLEADNYVDEEDLPVLQIEDLTSEAILQHHIDTGVLPEDATVEDLNIEVLNNG